MRKYKKIYYVVEFIFINFVKYYKDIFVPVNIQ